MSEGNERNLESIAPEAAESIENEAAKAEAPAQEPAAPEEKMEAAEAAEPEAIAEPEPAPAQPEGGEEDEDEEITRKPKSKKNGKKKRARRSAVIPLAIALVVVLLIFGILVGYGLGRVRSQREAGEVPQGEQPVESGAQSADAYDPFTEALTNENQEALDALAGVDASDVGEAAALFGEEDFFADGDEGEQPAAEPVAVAEYGDGQTLMSDEVLEEYNEELASYILSGYSEEEVAETLLDDVLHRMVGDRVLEEHAKEMGLYETTDEDQPQIEAAAREEYEDYLQYYLADVTGTADMTQEQIEAAAEAALMEAEGVSYEGVLAQTEQEWWKHKLYDAITSSVTVDDAAVQVAYDERLAAQKESFATYPDDFEFSQRSGEIILYNLPDYRAVKVLQLGFDDAEAAMAVYALSDGMAFLEEEESDAAKDQERQAELDGYYAEPEARAKEALEKLRGGADMDEMILSIGQDAGMRDERQRAMGYYVSANSTLWPEEFVAAAMALENVGDYSEPVRTEDGVCILQYVGEVPEGEVPLEDVREALTAEVLEAARDEAYAAQTDEWVAEENPNYYPERMQ